MCLRPGHNKRKCDGVSGKTAANGILKDGTVGTARTARATGTGNAPLCLMETIKHNIAIGGLVGVTSGIGLGGDVSSRWNIASHMNGTLSASNKSRLDEGTGDIGRSLAAGIRNNVVEAT